MNAGKLPFPQILPSLRSGSHMCRRSHPAASICGSLNALNKARSHFDLVGPNGHFYVISNALGECRGHSLFFGVDFIRQLAEFPGEGESCVHDILIVGRINRGGSLHLFLIVFGPCVGVLLGFDEAIVALRGFGPVGKFVLLVLTHVPFGVLKVENNPLEPVIIIARDWIAVEEVEGISNVARDGSGILLPHRIFCLDLDPPTQTN